MKHFKDYLVESERTYNYRIKFAGDVPSEFLKPFKEKLDQFDVVKFSTPKTTPVQDAHQTFQLSKTNEQPALT